MPSGIARSASAVCGGLLLRVSVVCLVASCTEDPRKQAAALDFAIDELRGAPAQVKPRALMRLRDRPCAGDLCQVKTTCVRAYENHLLGRDLTARAAEELQRDAAARARELLERSKTIGLKSEAGMKRCVAEQGAMQRLHQL